MFGKRIKLFTIFGFTVRLDVSWLFMAVLIASSMAQQFAAPPDGFAPVTAWTMGIVMTLALFMSIVLHELSHSLIARWHGMRMSGITLFLLGGVAEMEDEPPTPWAEFTMAIAGPIASVIIAVTCFAAAALGQGLAWPKAVLALLDTASYTNFALAIFNMVPAFPLDGGRVLRSILWGLKGSMGWATRVASVIGTGFGILLVGAGLFFMFVWPRGWQAVTWVLIGLFVVSAARMAHRQVRVREALHDVSVGQLVDPAILVPRWISVADFVRDFVYPHRQRVFAVGDESQLIGVIATDVLKSLPRDEWMSRTVGELAVPIPMEWMIAPEDSARAALERMSRSGLAQLFVIQDGRLAGVVRIQAIGDYLQLAREIEGR